MPARPDDTLDTERTMPGYTQREIVQRGLEGVLDDVAELLRDQIDFVRRSKSEPPDDGRPTWPSAA